MKQTSKALGIAAAFLAIISLLALAAIPFYHIFLCTYRLHRMQPEVWQGGIKAVLCTALSFAALSLPPACLGKAGKTRLFLLIGMFYLLAEGVLLPAALAFLYVEILSFLGAAALFLGNALRRGAQAGEGSSGDLLPYNESLPYQGGAEGSCIPYTQVPGQSPGRRLLYGIALWGSGAILSSLLGCGTIPTLRLYTLLLLFIACYALRGRSYRPFLSHAMQYAGELPTMASRLGFAILYGILLVLFAKTNTAIDFDSIWYGLKPEYTLVGPHSFYDYLGFSAFVHYYPKLMELLFLPISGFPDYSFIISGNIALYAYLMAEAEAFLRRFAPALPCGGRLLLLSAIFSIPACANTAATAKPDMLGCFLCFLAFSRFFAFFWEGGFSAFSESACAILLATCTKLTYLLWGGILSLFLGAAPCIRLFRQWRQGRQDRHDGYGAHGTQDGHDMQGRQGANCGRFLPALRQYCILYVSTLLCFSGIHYRTYRLTGYPLYPVFHNLWVRLGFRGRHFAKTESGLRMLPFSWKSIAARCYGYLFDPKDLPHVLPQWTSGLLFYCILCLLLSGLIRLGKRGCRSCESGRCDGIPLPASIPRPTKPEKSFAQSVPYIANEQNACILSVCCAGFWPPKAAIFLAKSVCIRIVNAFFKCAYYKKERCIKEALLGVCFLALLSAMLYYMLFMYSPDGNYFIFPILVLVLLSVRWMAGQERCAASGCAASAPKEGVSHTPAPYVPFHALKGSKPSSHLPAIPKWRSLFFGFSAACWLFVQLPVFFVSHLSWSYGTSAFANGLFGSSFDSPAQNKRIFYVYGFSRIAERVMGYGRNERVLSSSGPEPLSFRMPCSAEFFFQLGSDRYSNAKISGDYRMFAHYVDTIHPKAIILFEEDDSVLRQFALRYLSTHNITEVCRDRAAVLYELY